jgi:hypothetical protein
MWEMILDLGFSLLLVVGYAIYNKEEVYGGTDDPQA